MNTHTKTAKSAAIRGAVILALLVPLAACGTPRDTTGQPAAPVQPARQYEWQMSFEPQPRQYEWQIDYDGNAVWPD